jgi:hypothetical protein
MQCLYGSAVPYLQRHATLAATAHAASLHCQCCNNSPRHHLQVAADQEEAEKVKVVVAAEEKDVKAMQQQTQAIADAAQAELAEAMPALQAAIDSLKALNKNDIVEIKSFPKPPPLVQMTMEAVCILKQEKPDWDTVRMGGTCTSVLLLMQPGFDLCACWQPHLLPAYK